LDAPAVGICLGPVDGAATLEGIYSARACQPISALKNCTNAVDDITDLSLPSVLVLVATRNGEKWLPTQLSSVLRQIGVLVQVHVRDDNSTDSSRDIVQRAARVDSRLTLSDDHSSKKSAAGNFFELIRSAGTDGVDYVALCDQDDDWSGTKLHRAVTMLRSVRADGYSAAVEAEWPDGRIAVMSQSSAIREADYLFEGAGQGCTFVLSVQLFKRVQSLVQRDAGLVAQLHYHDWAIYALARTLGYVWYFDITSTMRYRQHAANDTGARSSLSGIRKRMELISSGWYARQVNAISHLVQAANKDDRRTADWLAIESTPKTLKRALRKTIFVARYGRRKFSDRMILILATLMGRL
jgi:rhamnosyltransferase